MPLAQTHSDPHRTHSAHHTLWSKHTRRACAVLCCAVLCCTGGCTRKPGEAGGRRFAGHPPLPQCHAGRHSGSTPSRCGAVRAARVCKCGCAACARLSLCVRFPPARRQTRRQTTLFMSVLDGFVRSCVPSIEMSGRQYGWPPCPCLPSVMCVCVQASAQPPASPHQLCPTARSPKPHPRMRARAHLGSPPAAAKLSWLNPWVPPPPAPSVFQLARIALAAWRMYAATKRQGHKVRSLTVVDARSSHQGSGA